MIDCIIWHLQYFNRSKSLVRYHDQRDVGSILSPFLSWEEKLGEKRSASFSLMRRLIRAGPFTLRLQVSIRFLRTCALQW